MNSVGWPVLASTLFSWHGKPRVLLNRVFIQGECEVSSKNSLKTKSFCKIPNVCNNTDILYSVPKCLVNIIFFLYVKVMTLLGTKVPISRDCSFPLASLSKLTSVGPVFQGQGTALLSGRGPSWPFRNLESVLFRM